MARPKKTPVEKTDEQAISIAQDLINKVGDLYPVLDEIAGNSNYLQDITSALERIAVALEKRSV